MKFFITCPSWISKITKKELEFLGFKSNILSTSSLETFWSSSDISFLNLWLRTPNKIFISLAEWKTKNFDELFDLVAKIDWKKYISESQAFVVNANTKFSTLRNIPSIQSIVSKSINKKLTQGWRETNEKIFPVEININLQNDFCTVALNTSWENLHKRWYRISTWEAPIKENLAASLILYSWYNFAKPLYDVACWSWTILIEAAMIAKNIAPGILRKFDFENFDWWKESQHNDENLEKIFLAQKIKAQEGVFKKNHTLIGYDILDFWKIISENTKKLWIEDLHFFRKDLTKVDNIFWTLITNPPYWERIDWDLINIYKSIANIFRKNDLKWWVITSYNFFPHIDRSRKILDLYNWKIEVKYFSK